MINHILVQSCDIVTITRNKFSDYVATAYTPIACRWREMRAIRRGNHAELSVTDRDFKQVWFAAGAAVAPGTILRFEGIFYEITELLKARRLGSNTVQFIKCEVKVTDVGIS